MQLVADASVAVKWIFPDNDETDVERAMSLFGAIRGGGVRLLQPPHWLAEVAAVCVRLDSRIAADAVRFLHAMQFAVAAAPEVYSRACELAEKTHHHLFDTLYHAVALTHEHTVLVTADRHYLRKAEKFGAILSLSDFSVR